MNAPPLSALAPDGTTPALADFSRQLRGLLPIAHRLALELSADRDLADDLVQEAALKAFVHYGQFKQGTNFRAWFIRILQNCVRSHWRQALRLPRELPMHSLEVRRGGASVANEGPLARTPDLADHVVSKLSVERISDAIGGLPEPYRVVCALYLLDDLPYAEIARILGCPLGTVRSRLHRARQMLRLATGLD